MNSGFAGGASSAIFYNEVLVAVSGSGGVPARTVRVVVVYQEITAESV